jgi:uncharacterized protein
LENYKKSNDVMKCRPGCAACCIVISISSPIPGMPDGKPAGVRCVNLGDDNLCRIHGTELYPDVCREFTPAKEMCGESAKHAFEYLKKLEQETAS